MKQVLKLSLIAPLSIFIAFNFVSAQTTTPPSEIINQNQQPNFSPIFTPYPQTLPTISQAPLPIQSPKQNIKPPSKTTPTPAPSSSAETLPKTQDLSEASAPLQTADPSSNLLYVIIPIIITIALFWKKLIELLKKKSVPRLPAEDDGTVCKICGGTGKITKKRKRSEPCGHCKGTGNDICHNCGGTGKYSTGFAVPQTQEEIDSLLECPYCEGKGFPPVRNICEFCKGKSKIEFEESYEEACPECKGSGHIAR